MKKQAVPLFLLGKEGRFSYVSVQGTQAAALRAAICVPDGAACALRRAEVGASYGVRPYFCAAVMMAIL